MRPGLPRARPALFQEPLDRLRGGLIAHPQASTDCCLAQTKLVEDNRTPSLGLPALMGGSRGEVNSGDCASPSGVTVLQARS